jgi:hypothetical protein
MHLMRALVQARMALEQVIKSHAPGAASVAAAAAGSAGAKTPVPAPSGGDAGGAAGGPSTSGGASGSRPPPGGTEGSGAAGQEGGGSAEGATGAPSGGGGAGAGGMAVSAGRGGGAAAGQSDGGVGPSGGGGGGSGGSGGGSYDVDTKRTLAELDAFNHDLLHVFRMELDPYTLSLISTYTSTGSARSTRTAGSAAPRGGGGGGGGATESNQATPQGAHHALPQADPATVTALARGGGALGLPASEFVCRCDCAPGACAPKHGCGWPLSRALKPGSMLPRSSKADRCGAPPPCGPAPRLAQDRGGIPQPLPAERPPLIPSLVEHAHARAGARAAPAQERRGRTAAA